MLTHLPISNKTSAIFSVAMICLGLLVFSNFKVFAQGATCAEMDPLCVESNITFAAGVNTGNAQSGPNYGCLGTQPNPAWYYMKIDEPGTINVLVTATPSTDIDFVLWGPFSSYGTAQSACSAMGSGGAFGNIVDCDYSASAALDVNITGSMSAGDVFVMLITNFGNQPAQIDFEKLPTSSGSTDCDFCLTPITANIGNCRCQGSNRIVTVSGIIGGAPTQTPGANYIYDVTGGTILSQTTSAPGSVTILLNDDEVSWQLVVQDGENCMEFFSGSCTELVNPYFTGVTGPVCSDEAAFTVTLLNEPSPYVGTISILPSNPGGVFAVSGNNVTVTPGNLPAGSGGQYQIVYSASAGQSLQLECEGYVTYAAVTLLNSYSASFTVPLTTCVNAPVSLTSAAGPTAAQSVWSGPGVTDSGINGTFSSSTPGVYTIVHTISGAGVCEISYSQTIIVDDCVSDCPAFNTIEPAVSETCSAGTVDFTISLGTTDGTATSLNGQTLNVAAITSPSNAIDNPYTGVAWNVGPSSFSMNSVGSAFGSITFPANNGCDVVEYQVFAWLTNTTITNLGLPATCRPFVATTVKVWPSTSGRSVTVSYSECTAYFTVPSCPTTMYAVTPSGADFVDVGSTTSQAITINTYGAPAACASSASNSPVAVTNQLTATAGSCGCSAGSRQVQVTAATGSGNYAYSAEGGTVNGSGLFTFSTGVFSGSVTVTDNTTGCQVNVPISCAPLINPIIIGSKGPFCLDDPISNLTITPNTINDGTFSGPGVTDGAGNTATFDPSTAGVGSHTITYTAATGQTAIGCAYTTTTIIEVTPNYDPTFLLQTNACIDDGNIALTLSTAPASIPSGVTADEIADWYGDGVTDGVGNAGGTFNTLTAGVGVHTICVDVGIPSCLATYCQTIEIYPAANATINNQQVCVTGASGSFTLTSLFSSTTTPGGTYTVTPLFGGGTYTISGDELLYTNLASSNPINQVQITYTVETLAGAGGVCLSTDQAVVTFEYNEPYFDAPSSFCTAEPDPDLTLYFNSNTTLGGFFTASANGPLGTYNNALISSAGILDMSAAQAAVGINGLIYIRYTVPTISGACVDVNHEQVVLITEDCTCPDIQDIQANLVNICDPVDDFTPITAFPVTVTVYLD
ncbi:hypothetical protein C7N43_38270, partial [Sphingobacteriales bacterium UPWRP_1]